MCRRYSGASPRRLVLLAVAAALMVGGWAGAGPLVAANQAKETPSLQRSGLQRKQISLKEFRGKVVLLNFWATWCPYCRKEIPHLVDLQSRLGGQ
ncbi:MAG TPA: TlpA disulfide reductase family protein, partial [Gammaproteobacteria bacterium]|nr:TlpA disulfide reductase family protein [Gammaproteobacteria bacterium]